MELQDRKILVLGAGYLGSALSVRCLKGGAQVMALTRNGHTADRLRQAGVNVICADLAGDSWHKEIGGHVDAAVVCVSSGGAGLEGYLHSYVEGMRSVSGWLATVTLGSLVYTSSTSVYPQDGGVHVDEECGVAKADLQDRAGLLLEAEKLVLTSCAGAVRRSILRLAGLYGPGRHLLLNQVRDGVSLLPGSGEQHLNLIHRDDAVNAVMSAWFRQDRPQELFNVTDGSAATRGEIVEWLSLRLGRPSPRFSGETPSRGGADRIVSNAKIKRLLGWEPLYESFREGYEAILTDRPDLAT